MADRNTRGSALLGRRAMRGKRPMANDLNQIVEHMDRQNTGTDSPIQVPNKGEGVGEITIQRFQITAVLDDYLVCVSWNGAAAGTQKINIAKPPLLRLGLASHAGVTFTKVSSSERTASDGTNPDETQVVVPSYEVDDEIYALTPITGGTGVKTAGVGGAQPKAIVRIDLNLDARAWAKEAT